MSRNAGVAHARATATGRARGEKGWVRTDVRGGSNHQVFCVQRVGSGLGGLHVSVAAVLLVSVGLVAGSQSTTFEPHASWPFSSTPWGCPASERGQLTFIFSKIFYADNLT